MESPFGRSRLLIYALPFILITIMSTAAGAQGLFGMGFPGASYLDGFWRGAVGCGTPGFGPGPTVYVGGSADYATGTAFDLSSDAPVLGILKIQHSYPNRGVWLGLTLPFDPGQRLGLYLSAWTFLHTGNVHSGETYNAHAPGVFSREWQVRPYWTILDGFAILRCCYGFSILGGFRYDHYDITLSDPINPIGIPSLPTDQADLNVRNFIPLIGTHYENNCYLGSLVFRAVGFPALGGDVEYSEPFAGVIAFRGTGNYRRGYFFELFMEYSRKFGPSQLGLFARWNDLHAQSTVSADFLVGGAGGRSGNFDFSLNRSSWTLGGSVNLAFNLPY